MVNEVIVGKRRQKTKRKTKSSFSDLGNECRRWNRVVVESSRRCSCSQRTCKATMLPMGTTFGGRRRDHARRKPPASFMTRMRPNAAPELMAKDFADAAASRWKTKKACCAISRSMSSPRSPTTRVHALSLRRHLHPHHLGTRGVQSDLLHALSLLHTTTLTHQTKRAAIARTLRGGGPKLRAMERPLRLASAHHACQRRSSQRYSQGWQCSDPASPTSWGT